MLASGFAQYLTNAGLVTYDPDGVTGDAFVEVVPSTPDQVVILTGTAGDPPDASIPYGTPGLQVRVRSTPFDPRPAHARALAIYGALHHLHHVDLPDGTRVIGCHAMTSGPEPLGNDENNRPEYVINFRVHIHQPTTHRS